MNEEIQSLFDENNNEDIRGKRSALFVERHLELGSEGDNFLIIPNGGSGDCMFKAVSQAVYMGDESKHREIRKRVVNFIISQRWDKFSESIEVQHINGNNLLQRQWAKDPKEAYKMYMTMAGTLGSSSELTAAGELFHYNFATIQEYCSSTQNTYRVENCVLFDEDSTDFHYFYFTGDYDNGHWEYIKILNGKKLDDGTYQGRHRILINGEDISFEDWLRRETENSNDADQLKIATNHDLFAKRRTSHPFELKGYNFCRDGTVRLNGNSFTIAPVQHSDLFSVLAHECLKNEASAHDIELILMKHRYSYFEDLNYKLINQPWSHNFTVDAIRYCAQSLKGIIQDLIGAADLYSFSFVLFLKMSDNEDTHLCKFTHVDRWGGESDRTLYFFMRLSRCTNGEKEQLIAKWWRLIPVDSNSPKTSEAKLFNRKSVARLEGVESRTSSIRSSATYVEARPVTTDVYSSTQSFKRPQTSISSSRPLTVHGSSDARLGSHQSVLNTAEDILQGVALAQQQEPKVQVLEGGITVTRVSESGGETEDDSFEKDHEKLFGPRPVSRKTSQLDSMPSWQKSSMRLVKKTSVDSAKMEKIKPATGRDLLNNPEKVRTVVKIRDSGRELTYRGSGYMKADDVLKDLKSQGLIRMTTPTPGRVSSVTGNIKSSDMDLQKIQRLLSDGSDEQNKHYDELLELRDENFNVLSETKQDENENEGSDVSYEKFDDPENEEDESAEEPTGRMSHHGQQFPPHELLPLAKEYSRNRMNKVAPNPVERPSSNRHYEYMDDEYLEKKNSCLTQLTQLLHTIGRIFSRLGKYAGLIKKDFIRRYERRRSSSTSLISYNKRQKTFPQRRY